MSDDQRVEAVARARYERANPIGDWDNHTHIVKDVFRLQAERDIAAADAADREAGIHRVRVDDDTVERVVEVMRETFHLPRKWDEHARAVLAALTGAGQ